MSNTNQVKYTDFTTSLFDSAGCSMLVGSVVWLIADVMRALV